MRSIGHDILRIPFQMLPSTSSEEDIATAAFFAMAYHFLSRDNSFRDENQDKTFILFFKIISYFIVIDPEYPEIHTP